MELTKYQASQVIQHIRHDLRDYPEGKSPSNESINPSMSHLNCDVVKLNGRKNVKEINQYRHRLEKEIFRYNRKNLIHAVEICLQCPSDCPEYQHEAFFKESYNYLVSTLPMGERCVLLAKVHRDEYHYSPTGEMISKEHMHFMFVPAVRDSKHEGYEWKLCADALTRRHNLQKLHPGLQKYLDQKGIRATVYTGSKNGKIIPLTVPQLKQLTESTGITLKKSLTVEEFGALLREHKEYSAQIKELISSIRMKDETICQLKQQLQEYTEKKALDYDPWKPKTYVTSENQDPWAQQSHNVKHKIKEDYTW